MITLYDPKALLSLDAPNFRQYEVGKSEHALKNDIDNTPTLEILENAAILAVKCLQPIRDHFGLVSINSWFRSEEVEKHIARDGYVKYLRKHSLKENAMSWQEYFLTKSHPKGRAADFEIPGHSNDEVFAWCKANLKFDQLIREFPKAGISDSGWVHISINEENNRQMAFVVN